MAATGEIDGFKVLLLSYPDAELEAAFCPSAGMVCASLRHRGEEILGQRGGLRGYAEERSTMGIPLLYPWANRLSTPSFELAGREVEPAAADPPPKTDGNGLPIHGLLSAAAGWRVDRHEPSVLEASFEFAAGDALTTGFPFPHTLRLRAELGIEGLTITTSVSADAGSPVPVAFGFHPYLTLPGVPRGDWEIEAPLPVRLEMYDSVIPTGERRPSGPLDGSLGGRAFDDAFLAPRPGDAFALSGGGRLIEVRFGPGYDYAQLYAPPGQDLLAYEPMTAPANALVSGDGLRVLEPGASFEAAFEVSVRA